MQKIPENTLLIIKSVVPLVIILILFLILGNIGLTKIRLIRGEITDANKEKALLTEKLDILRTVAVNGVRDSNEASNSLPDNNPALAVTYQIRNMAASSGLILNSLKARADSGSDEINAVNISFTVIGGKSVVQNFLLNIKTIAPITTLTKVKVSDLGDVYSGDVAVSSYWSALPTQLPATIEGLEELTAEDKETLAIVNGLTQPVFVELPPAQAGGKTDPFSQ